MVDRYYRKINDVESNIENAIQISAILLKLKRYDVKLADLSKIGDNENNIPSNLSKIGDNENNISSNLEKIGNIKEFLISFENLIKILILKNKYLDLIELHIFTLFLKKK